MKFKPFQGNPDMTLDVERVVDVFNLTADEIIPKQVRQRLMARMG